MSDTQAISHIAALPLSSDHGSFGPRIQRQVSGADSLLNVTLGPGAGTDLGSCEDADFVILSGDPLSVYAKVFETWVEGRRAFDRNNPADRLYAVGGYGAGHDQSPYLCCYDDVQQGDQE